jgi:hypothetical protein
MNRIRARWNIGAHGLSQDELSQRFACTLMRAIHHGGLAGAAA